jgi:phosphoglycolate phosphatase-like HAD superfamily hydrolase
MRNISVLMTDLDNTLFDWVESWHRSFTAQLEAVRSRTGLPTEQLLSEFRLLHQKYGTSEYRFAAAELPSLSALDVSSEDLYNAATTAIDEAQQSALTLYPGVRETLDEVRQAGALVVGYTESMQLYTKARLAKLGLDDTIDYVYTPPNHEFPTVLPGSILLKWRGESGPSSRTVYRLTPPGELKPNPKVLRDIMSAVGADPRYTAYVGDSKLKDISMAQDAGVLDIWAAYGAAQHREAYSLLRAVTHWTRETVELEKTYRAPREPTLVLTHSFAEMRGLLRFQSFSG